SEIYLQTIVLQTNPILAEIRRIFEEKCSGVLALSGERNEFVELFFREGLIEAASSNLAGRRIGDYLMKDNSLDEHDLNSIETEAKRRKVLFGEAAVQKRPLVEQSDVAAAVRAQGVDLVEYVLRNKFIVESFKGSLPSYRIPARLSFFHVLLEFC